MAPTDRTRRLGYAVAVFINLVILYLLNVQPGWQALSFLTDTTPRVLVLVNLSLLAGIVANAVYIGADGPWVKTVGDLTTTTISLAVLIRIWQVFPFDFGAWTIDWALVARVVLVAAFVGTGIALLAQTIALLRLTLGRFAHPGGHALR